MKELNRCAPSVAHVDPRGVRELFEALNELNCHQVMITRDNSVIAEGYWDPYKKGFIHITYSINKSFTCTAVGMAIDEGLLSEDDFVLRFFPDALPAQPCANMKKMRVRHLLTMSTGVSNERGTVDDEATWLNRFLYNYVDEEPGKRFCYNSGSTYVLGCIIRKVTGINVFDYLKPRLFEPMGFSEDIWWEQSPQGMNTCFNGFNATVEDLTKLALLYRNGGVWEGKRLLSQRWVEKASAFQIDNSDNGRNERMGITRQGFGHFSRDYKSGYGFLFWHCAHEGAYRGDGIYGQLAIVLPRERMTVAVLAGHPEPGEILEAIWKHLIPAVDRAGDAAESAKICAYTAGLHLSIAQGERSSPLAGAVSGRVYRFDQNGLGLESIRLDFGEQNRLTLITAQGVLSAPVGYSEWINTRTGYDSGHFSCDNQWFYDHVGCCGAWQGDEFVIRIAYTRTPFVDEMRIRFRAHHVQLHYRHTVKMYQMSYDLYGIAQCDM